MRWGRRFRLPNARTASNIADDCHIFTRTPRLSLSLGVFGVHRHHGNRPNPTPCKAMLSLPPTVFWTVAHPAQNGSKRRLLSPISSREPFRLENTRGTFYELAAWAVMPNHARLLILPKAPVRVILRWLKGSTARKANLLLRRTGRRFWQDESCDHWVRNGREFERIIHYIEKNPVTAGLVTSATLWPWSSAGWQAKPPAPPTSDLSLEM